MNKYNILAILLGVSLVTSGSIAALPADHSSLSSSPRALDSASDEILESRINITQGEKANFTVNTPFEKYMGVTITSLSTGQSYFATFSPIDEDGDGQVTVQINSLTAQSATSRNAYSALGNDELRHTVVFSNSVSNESVLPPGSYRIGLYIAGEQTDTAMLSVSPRSIENIEVLSAPPNGSYRLQTLSQSAPDNTIAAGEGAVIRINAPGFSQSFSDTPPGARALYVTPSIPTSNATHTLQFQATNRTLLKTVRVDYAAGDGGTPRNLDRLNTTNDYQLGIDTDRDGQVEIEIPPGATQVSSSAAGQLEFRIAKEGYLLRPGDVLIAQYQVVNPSTETQDSVQIMINEDVVQTTVSYGFSGDGALGYGLDFHLIPHGETQQSQPVFLRSTTYRYNSTSEEGYIIIPTTSDQIGQTYTATLRFTPNDEANRSQTLTTSYTVVKNEITISQNVSFIQTRSENPTFSGTTTLRPGTKLLVMLEKSPPVPMLAGQPVTVRPGGTWETSFNVSNLDPGMYTLRVSSVDREISAQTLVFLESDEVNRSRSSSRWDGIINRSD